MQTCSTSAQAGRLAILWKSVTQSPHVEMTMGLQTGFQPFRLWEEHALMETTEYGQMPPMLDGD